MPDWISNAFSSMSTVLVVLGMVAVFVIVLALIAGRYKKVSPNTIAVVSGRKHKVADGATRGYRYIIGGGFILFPVLEKMEEMSLNVMKVKVAVKDVPDKNGALVSVDAVANVKILSDDASVPLAIERFLGRTLVDIEDIIKDTLEGNLRNIVGTMEIDGLLSKREEFTQNVINEAGTDLRKMGIGVDVLKIQDVKDVRGYIQALGKKKTAEVVRDASIGEAEAKRETDQKTAAADQAGAIAKAEADRAISDAQRARDMAIADNEAQVGARQAQIPVASDIAKAERQKDLNVANVAAQVAQTEAEIGLQEVQARRNAAEYHATIVVKADKEREARLIVADAAQQAAEREGEAVRVTMLKKGEGERALMTAQAEGRKAAAEATQAEMVAKANGEQAELLARAEGTKAQGLADAAATQAKLLAEAEGTLKKAEAFKALDEGGRFLLIMEAMPPVIHAIGAALKEVVVPAADAIGKGLANIDELRIIDMGGNGKANGSALHDFAGMPVETLYKIGEKVKSLGAGPYAQELLKMAGVDFEQLMAKLAEKQPKTVEGEVVPAGAAPEVHG